jgi:hypothetical protein
MTRQQEMAREIGYWVEDVGYEAVLAALIGICQQWAAMETKPPHGVVCTEASRELWEKRGLALRRAAVEGQA